jgi:hypothetical protein
MTDKDQQLKQFRDAVDRKGEEAAKVPPEAAERGAQRSLEEAGRPPDVESPRAKSSGHGKKTADKWNQ